MRRTIDKIDVRAPRKCGRENNNLVPVLLDQERRQDVHSSQGNRVEDGRPWWQNWWGRHQKRSASERPKHAQRREQSEGQLVMQLK